MKEIDSEKDRELQEVWKHYLLKEIESEKGRDLQEVWKHYLLETIDSKKEFVSCRKYECIIYRGNRVEERDSQQEGRWNTPNSVKIGQEVRFKTPFLVEYSARPKEISPITEYCWGNKIIKAELKVERSLFSI